MQGGVQLLHWINGCPLQDKIGINMGQMLTEGPRPGQWDKRDQGADKFQGEHQAGAVGSPYVGRGHSSEGQSHV